MAQRISLFNLVVLTKQHEDMECLHSEEGIIPSFGDYEAPAKEVKQTITDLRRGTL